MMTKYSTEIEGQMLAQFKRLGEKEQRLYAALESQKLGYGGQTYLSGLFGITRYRILMGIKELANPALLATIPEGKQRRSGGGRKKKMSVTQN
jgi:hypothetical protein